jgi:hypothetical protein
VGFGGFTLRVLEGLAEGAGGVGRLDGVGRAEGVGRTEGVGRFDGVGRLDGAGRGVGVGRTEMVKERLTGGLGDTVGRLCKM